VHSVQSDQMHPCTSRLTELSENKTAAWILILPPWVDIYRGVQALHLVLYGYNYHRIMHVLDTPLQLQIRHWNASSTRYRVVPETASRLVPGSHLAVISVVIDSLLLLSSPSVVSPNPGPVSGWHRSDYRSCTGTSQTNISTTKIGGFPCS
jgi:hypothetical protein